MRKLALILAGIFLIALCGCTKFEVRNEIHPEIVIMGDTVGLTYMLGDLKVSDSLEDISGKFIRYFKQHEDDLVLSLHIDYNEAKHTEIYFTYFLRGLEIAQNTNVVSSDILLAHRDSIDGFLLIQLDGENMLEEEQDKVLNEPQLGPTQEPEKLEQKPVKTERRLGFQPICF
jgi:hypothetical protein